MSSALREKLVAIALEWQERYGIAPKVTTPDFSRVQSVDPYENQYVMILSLTPKTVAA